MIPLGPIGRVEQACRVRRYKSQVAQGSSAQFKRIDWTHPLLAPHFDPTFCDFALVRART